jgi:hypothetical protein
MDRSCLHCTRPPPCYHGGCNHKLRSRRGSAQNTVIIFSAMASMPIRQSSKMSPHRDDVRWLSAESGSWPSCFIHSVRNEEEARSIVRITARHHFLSGLIGPSGGPSVVPAVAALKRALDVERYGCAGTCAVPTPVPEIGARVKKRIMERIADRADVARRNRVATSVSPSSIIRSQADAGGPSFHVSLLRPTDGACVGAYRTGRARRDDTAWAFLLRPCRPGARAVIGPGTAEECSEQEDMRRVEADMRAVRRRQGRRLAEGLDDFCGDETLHSRLPQLSHEAGLADRRRMAGETLADAAHRARTRWEKTVESALSSVGRIGRSRGVRPHPVRHRVHIDACLETGQKPSGMQYEKASGMAIASLRSLLQNEPVIRHLDLHGMRE